MFDLNRLKEQGVDEATLTELATHLTDLEGQRDAARKESMEGRKTLKTRVSDLERERESLFDRLGVSSLDELETLPDPKGQAEAQRQYEAKLKRLQQSLEEKERLVGELSTRHRQTRQEAALNQALSRHEFIDRDLVASFAAQRVKWEEDQLYYQTEGGALVALDEGITQLAQSKPHLLIKTGARGSGYSPATGKPAGLEKNPWSKEHRNLTEQARLLHTQPELAAQLKAAAEHP